MKTPLFLSYFRKNTIDEPTNELQNSLDQTLRELSAARINFSEAVDTDLVDSYAYEIKSLESRYSYLVRLAQKDGLTSTNRLRSSEI